MNGRRGPFELQTIVEVDDVGLFRIDVHFLHGQGVAVEHFVPDVLHFLFELDQVARDFGVVGSGGGNNIHQLRTHSFTQKINPLVLNQTEQGQPYPENCQSFHQLHNGLLQSIIKFELAVESANQISVEDSFALLLAGFNHRILHIHGFEG